MTTNNNRFHQNMLPGLNPITAAALEAAKLAYEQERIKTEQERQQLFRDQQQYAANKERRDQANHAGRQARENDAHTARQYYEAKRSRLDEQYKQEQLNFMQARARMQHQSDLVNQLCGLMKTFGQLWYWEEQTHIQQVDVAMRHRENWEKIRLQALNDEIMRQIAFLKSEETKRHNISLESEAGRHNRQMEVNNWWISIQRFREECRSNHVREFTQAWKEHFGLLETKRANNMRGQNDANRNAEQFRHNARMEDQQAQLNAARLAQSRGGCKGVISVVLWTIGTLFAFFILLCAYVFTHWAGDAQPYDGTCNSVFLILFLIIGIVIAVKIRSGIVKRRKEKEYQQQLLAWQQYLASVPPSLQVQQEQVPPWMYSQYNADPFFVMPPMPELQQYQGNQPTVWQVSSQFNGTQGNQQYSQFPPNSKGQLPSGRRTRF